MLFKTVATHIDMLDFPRQVNGINSIFLIKRRLRARLRTIFFGFLLLVTVLPFIRTFLPLKARPLEEMRSLAPFPHSWEGNWPEIDKNFKAFERWYSDHFGFRNIMIRTKNEIDYRVFRSSSRVYFGKHGELYGRNLADVELPATEQVLKDDSDIEKTVSGVKIVAEQLRRNGITMLMVPVLAKQYYTRERLPFFAPRISENSRFVKLYEALRRSEDIQFIDTNRILLGAKNSHQLFYNNDFHWTDMSAMDVAGAITNRIAELENSGIRWNHELRYEAREFTGSESRFSARLNGRESILQPQLVRTWSETRQQRPLDSKTSGLEFDTDTENSSNTLPETCMYGNSFSDGFIRAGMLEYYRKFTKIDRALPVPEAPRLVAGKCKYLIVQILDIQAYLWNDFKLLAK